MPAHRHLGASSHSGNARGGCRGCIPFRLGRTHSEINDRDHFNSVVSEFLAPAQKSSARIPPQTPPARGIQIRNPAEFQKESAEILRNPFPRKLLSQNLVRFVLRSPALYILESSMLRTEARSARGTLVSFVLKIGSNLVQ